MDVKINLPSVNGYLAASWLNPQSDGATIIFLHDALGSTATWRAFPAELTRMTNCRALVYDRLGHGFSARNPHALKRGKKYLEKEADFLLEIIDHLKIAHPILLGHSDGASIALIAAAKHTQSIKGLIAEAAHVFVEDITVNAIQAVKTHYASGVLRDKLRKYHGEKADTLFAAWANTWLNPSYRNWNIESFLPDIECPCLILQGEDDIYGSIEQVHRIKSGIRADVTVHLLKKIGHNPHKENSQKVLRLMCDFINALR